MLMRSRIGSTGFRVYGFLSLLCQIDPKWIIRLSEDINFDKFIGFLLKF